MVIIIETWAFIPQTNDTMNWVVPTIISDVRWKSKRRIGFNGKEGILT